MAYTRTDISRRTENPHRGKRANILLVANYASDVGYAWWLMEAFWAAIAEHFAIRGRRTVLIYPAVTDISPTIADAPIRVLEHDYADRSPSGLRALARLIRENHIGGVYLTDQPYYSLRYVQLRLMGIKRIIMHDHMPGERPRPKLYLRMMKQLIHALGVFSCDHYIGVSQFVRDRFIQVAGIPSSRCSYVTNGIQPVQVDRAVSPLIRQQWSIPQDALLVASTGRATFYKGIEFLVDVAAEVIHKRKREDVYFLHCGDGPDLEAFRKLVGRAGVGDRFIVAGRRNDVRAILGSADIGLHASRGEAFSLSILEYMSAGLATLAPNHCGNPEAIDHEVTGFLYEPEEKAIVAERIIDLANDQATRRCIGDAARQTVLKRFTLDRAVQDLVRVVEHRL